MSTTGLEVFDKTIHETNVWLKEIMDDVGPDRQRAYHALRAVLHALRDRLTVDEAAHLSAQLPMMVRGIYFEGWRPAATPTRERSRQEFLAHVSGELQRSEPINADVATRAVFRTLRNHVTAGQADKVRDMLPKPIAELWP